MTAKGGGWLGGEGTEQKGKRTHGHGQQYGFGRVGDIRGLNGNGKNILKNVMEPTLEDT